MFEAFIAVFKDLGPFVSRTVEIRSGERYEHSNHIFDRLLFPGLKVQVRPFI